MCGLAMSSKPSKTEADYRAEDDHRTLTRAEEIRADKTRMAAVERHHNKTMRAMARVGKAIVPAGSKRRTPSRGGGR